MKLKIDIKTNKQLTNFERKRKTNFEIISSNLDKPTKTLAIMTGLNERSVIRYKKDILSALKNKNLELVISHKNKSNGRQKVISD
ncbi:hypothetical protein [Mycoplasma seminis]|nr:hypothetical protein [Mycoplasma seminis]WLP85942.1 hypothetical protein Q8852_02245 [Mycoplasma seminis]